ncbi:MAG: cyclic nucleotide-binding domain-containing protein [Verrucomicrobiota bacterium]|nr:cyclic nucleotide-binding domain-containing protein [Limisphaerales bacterium]
MSTPSSTGMPPDGTPPDSQLGADGWKTHPFLRDLNPGLLTPLAACAMPTVFKAGELIFREGELANRFYLIVAGRVQLEAEATDRPGVLVDYIGPDDVLGWSWLFPPYTWNFTARAVEPVRAIFFYGTWLRERCDADPALGYELMKRTTAVVIRRLQAARQQLVFAAARPVAG